MQSSSPVPLSEEQIEPAGALLASAFVGEVMAIGRTFAESLQKALRGLETGLTGLDEVVIEGLGQGDDKNAIRAALGQPRPDRLLIAAQALRHGASVEEILAHYYPGTSLAPFPAAPTRPPGLDTRQTPRIRRR